VRSGVLAPWIVLALAGAGVALLQPHLALAAHKAGDREDVYALPPREQLHAATLGWDAAAVDALWATLLVRYGSHWAEHRPFDDVGRYADAILELEPNYRPLFKSIEALVLYHPLTGTTADARAAKRYLELGVERYPDDHELWLQLGLFAGYTGNSYLTDPKELDAWRAEGARAIDRAVQLGADPQEALYAAHLYAVAGELGEQIVSLERMYAVTDQPSMTELHEVIGERLRLAQEQLAVRRGEGPAPPMLQR
jgi:hypothetical protein